MENTVTYAHNDAAKESKGFFARLATKFAAFKAERRAISELRQLSDRELNDLGISRYDIVRVVKGA